MPLNNKRIQVSMIKKYVYSIILCLFSTTVMQAQNIVEHQKDSLRQRISETEGKDKLRAYMRLSYLYMAELGDDLKMDTLLVLFDEIEEEARKQGDLSQQGIVRGNRIVAFENKGMYDESIRRAPETLKFLADNELWRFYYVVFSVVTDSYCNKGDYDGAISAAGQVYELAKERSDKEGMGVALYTMANVYNHQKRWADMETNLRECIALLYDSDLYLNILTQSYAFLSSALRMQDRYDEALRILPEFEQAIQRYEKCTSSPQYEAWGNYYVASMNTYLDMGEYDKAEIWMKKVESAASQPVWQYELLRVKALILASHKKYEEALIKIDSAMLVVGDQDNFMLNRIRQSKMGILIQMGRPGDAEQLFDDFVAVQDSIYTMEVNAQLDELRTQYEVDRHIAEKERNRNYFLFALGGCILMFLLLGGAVYYNRVVANKNRGLYRQIKEQDRLAEELVQLTNYYETQNSSEASPDTTVQPFPGNRQQRELVTRLREYLLADGNLSSIDINRDELSSALGTNRNTLSVATKVVTGKTLIEYIRIMQLEEVRKLLDTHPELTVEAIASDCGFNSLPTLYRLFRKHYGISPAEYRKLAASMQN